MLIPPQGMAHDVEDEQQDRDASAVARARRGAWAAFCVTGLVAASWAGRVPAVAERLDLSAGGLAVAVLGIEGGALVGLPLGGALVTRWGSRLGLSITGAPATVIGSHALLLQMITNLLHNAVVHNSSCGGTVEIKTTTGPESVVLTVENTGDVLPPDLVATLTEPFQRGTERVHSDHAGVGLGLAIVQSIARAHDGALTVIPRDGGGLRVSVELPRTSREDPGEPQLTGNSIHPATKAHGPASRP